MCASASAGSVKLSELSKRRRITAGMRLRFPACCGSRSVWALGRWEQECWAAQLQSLTASSPLTPNARPLRLSPVSSPGARVPSRPRPPPNALPALAERPHPAARSGALRQPEGGAAAAGEGRLAARHRQGELPPAAAAAAPPARPPSAPPCRPQPRRGRGAVPSARVGGRGRWAPRR